MSATPGRTTLLQAVNTVLATIGEQPVNTLEDQQVLEARQAESAVLEFHREGQIRGWSWNREQAYPFARGSDGEMRVPANVASWQPDIYEHQNRYQLRGQRVYDTEQHSYRIPHQVLNADVVWLLSWDDCPEAYNRYALIRAARVFSARFIGDAAGVQFSAADERQALIELERVENSQTRPNLLNGNRQFPTFQPAQGLVNRHRGGLFW